MLSPLPHPGTPFHPATDHCHKERPRGRIFRLSFGLLRSEGDLCSQSVSSNSFQIGEAVSMRNLVRRCTKCSPAAPRRSREHVFRNLVHFALTPQRRGPSICGGDFFLRRTSSLANCGEMVMPRLFSSAVRSTWGST